MQQMPMNLLLLLDGAAVHLLPSVLRAHFIAYAEQGLHEFWPRSYVWGRLELHCNLLMRITRRDG